MKTVLVSGQGRHHVHGAEAFMDEDLGYDLGYGGQSDSGTSNASSDSETATDFDTDFDTDDATPATSGTTAAPSATTRRGTAVAACACGSGITAGVGSAGATRGCPTCPPRSRRGGILGAGALASYEEQEANARAPARPWRADRVVASERLSARP